MSLLTSSPTKCKGSLGYRACRGVAGILFAALVMLLVLLVLIAISGCRAPASSPILTSDTLKGGHQTAAAIGAIYQPSVTLVWSNQEMWIGNQVESASRPDGPWQLYARMTNGTNFVVSFTVPRTNGWRFYRVGAFRP